ncbi:Bug family tripartite tricarboxylate transporter substrate binding protein [Saccharospirillum sp.]|uniref:Bug family tripartite tricarboxylate transporter substrate binding protein n=1 Tax=Saccharospirillum sp. TaxID=2033801 RepID=UPI0034A0A2DC
MRNITKNLSMLALALGTTAALSMPANAESAEEFYDGKTLRFMSTTGAGGTMDLYMLLTMKHMEKHLPESMDTVLEHRTGAGGAVGANYLFQAAPKDGTIIGMPVPAIVSSKFANPDTIRYEADEFQAVGRIVDLPRIYVARGDAGYSSLTELADSGEQSNHGIMTVGTSFHQYMAIANLGLGTNFREVAGYSGGGPTFLAMEQGEVASTTAEPANLFANKWHLVESGDVNVLAIGGLERMGQLPDTPTIMELIDESNDYYDIARSVVSSGAIGLSLIAPPGVPEDRIEFLREAFNATMADPEFIAEAQERSIPINPQTGEYVDTVIADSANVSENVKAWFFEMAQGN